VSLILKKSSRIPASKGPVLLVVMDGVGVGPKDRYDGVFQARTPTLDQLSTQALYRTLKAHGRSVGLPSDADMGNSEVGHNALGAGRVFDQGAKLVKQAIASSSIYQGAAWGKYRERCAGNGGALHFIGLLSDGNVHSHQDHLHAMIEEAARENFPRVFVHVLLDGRDVPETSALTYLDRLEEVLGRLDGTDGRQYRIASGGGRMVTTMDRYEADWPVVERGWNAHVHGDGRRFQSARQAVETFRQEDFSAIDQFLPPFVIEADGAPVGTIQDGDAVVFYNFRGDRAIEISRAFEAGDEFDSFDRGRRPEVLYAGMTLYDGDEQIPNMYLVSPPAIDRTMGEYLAGSGVSQFALSETQKYGHVTYFWNGNRGGKFDPALETYVEIPSDLVPFEQRPWMKAAEITDRTIEALRSGKHRFLRINYANGDMVGHTGDLQATVTAVQAVDLCLARLVPVVDALQGSLIILADHGNADDMVERNKSGEPQSDTNGAIMRKTSHTLNPVPFILHRPGDHRLQLRAGLDDAGLANVAATVCELLGYEPPEGYLDSLLK